MSASDAKASIGYGFLVPKEVADESKVDLEDLLDEKESKTLDFMFFGDCFSDNYQIFIIIKDSELYNYAWQDGPIEFNPQELKDKPIWKQKLKQWAKNHNILNPKIGWQLSVSI